MATRPYSESPSDRAGRIKTPQEALAAIQRYCAYQERSHQEVKRKLFDYGLHTDEVNELLARLITEGFLNEERFAKAFAGGKFRMKQWGRLKIEHELEHRGLTKNCIVRGINEIDASDYAKTLKGLIAKRVKQTPEINIFKKRNKVARFAISKGYEPELVWEVVKDLLP
ncbi:MAG TPA: regulatory protein RecX [Cyclobacteriaceae bacterium]|nr:regulatory protein RecX [Cyclobacteriaceae bacterium]